MLAGQAGQGALFPWRHRLQDGPDGTVVGQDVSGDRVNVLENRRTVVAIAGYL